jgi:hypothetical protein
MTRSKKNKSASSSKSDSDLDNSLVEQTIPSLVDAIKQVEQRFNDEISLVKSQLAKVLELLSNDKSPADSMKGSSAFSLAAGVDSSIVHPPAISSNDSGVTSNASNASGSFAGSHPQVSSITSQSQPSMSGYSILPSSISTVTPSLPAMPITSVISNGSSYNSNVQTNASVNRSPLPLRNATQIYKGNINARSGSSDADINWAQLATTRKFLTSPSDFKGDANSWLTFEHDFYRFWDVGRFNADDMLSKLRRWISGDARTHVESLLCGATYDPDDVMRALRKEFFKPTVMVSKSRIDLLALGSCQNGDREAMKTLLSGINKHINLHSQLGMILPAVDDEIENLLSFDALREWRSHSYADSNDDIPTRNSWNDLKFVLDKHMLGLPFSNIQRKPSTNSQSHQPSTNKDRKHKHHKFVNNIPSNSSDEEQSQASADEEQSQASADEEQSQASADEERSTTSAGEANKKKASRRCFFDQCGTNATYNCVGFLNLPPKERRNFMVQRKRCIRCFGPATHLSNACPNPNIPDCKAKDCRNPKEHSSALHDSSIHNICTSVRQQKSRGDFSSFLMIPVIIKNSEGQPVKALAFMDSGADVSIVDEALFKSLGLPSSPNELSLNFCAAGMQGVDNKSRIFDLEIAPMDDPDNSFTMRNVVSLSTLSLPTQSQHPGSIKKRYPWMKEVPIPSFNNKLPRILIGIGHAQFMRPLETVSSPTIECPVYAVRTLLGWGIVGAENKSSGNKDEISSNGWTIKERHRPVCNSTESHEWMQRGSNRTT